jgi:hypothetical protein
MIVLGTDLGSALFRAKLAIVKQAERAWHAYIERKICEMLKGRLDDPEVHGRL